MTMNVFTANQMNPSNMEQSEAIQEVWADVWSGFDLHVSDKQYYPRYVAYAVAHTVAQVNLSIFMYKYELLVLFCKNYKIISLIIK